ncbi:Gfo/Idh/MocA family protein [Sulfurihydrogenibium azorense]|uniref:Gfo/Idh/MocA family protein n=1 Tax=Sulfurihydrogenibium azorense TaxID=309806 RepID=UPI00240A2ABF|nr:Gfo/Idh/MocA family oxidoreductase [Sulfurihydrogenibium azorense]
MKVGIVGIGNMGSKYVNKFRELNLDYVLIDSNQSQFEKYPEDVPKYTDLEDALEKENINFLFVATSPTSHIPIARKAIERNINVMVEKPPALSRRDFEDILDFAYKNNVILAVSEIELNSSSVRNLKINGKVENVEGYRLNLGKGYINPFFDLAWHDLYIFNYLFGNFSIKKVSIEGNNVYVNANSDNTEFNLQVAWLNPFLKRSWHLKSGSEETLLDFVEDKIIYPSGEVVEKDNIDKLKMMIEKFIKNPSYESSLRALNILKEIEKINI